MSPAPECDHPAVPPPGGRWWRIALGPGLFLLVELLFRPDPAITEHPELVRHALAATVWLGAWWFTEALPVPVTSLLPIVLFPLLGLASTAEVAREYGHEIIFLFLGGFLIALAMERTGLQERLSMLIVRRFGGEERKLVLGFMVATAVMSMWISNTATTVMLLPLALALLGRSDRERHRDGAQLDQPFAVALLLGIAFAANIGGLGTPIGSPPNIIFQSLYRQKTGEEVSFLRWMLYGVPVVVTLLPLAWWLLVRKLEPVPAFARELPVFGALSSAERWVLGVFLVTVLLWLTRGDVGAFQGWGSRLGAHGIELSDSNVAIAAALLLFIVPASSGAGSGAILDWSVAPRLPWGVLLLMGAGFAISAAFDASGLTLWLGTRLEGLGRLAVPEPLLLVMLIAAVAFVSILVTEFASNTASAGIMLPVVYGISAGLGTERFPPEPLMVACAIACTTGFAVPAGTPPNALVFATERISIGRFVRTGLRVDLLALIVIVSVVGIGALIAARASSSATASPASPPMLPNGPARPTSGADSGSGARRELELTPVETATGTAIVVAAPFGAPWRFAPRWPPDASLGAAPPAHADGAVTLLRELRCTGTAGPPAPWWRCTP